MCGRAGRHAAGGTRRAAGGETIPRRWHPDRSWHTSASMPPVQSLLPQGKRPGEAPERGWAGSADYRMTSTRTTSRLAPLAVASLRKAVSELAHAHRDLGDCLADAHGVDRHLGHDFLH